MKLEKRLGRVRPKFGHGHLLVTSREQSRWLNLLPNGVAPTLQAILDDLRDTLRDKHSRAREHGVIGRKSTAINDGM